LVIAARKHSDVGDDANVEVHIDRQTGEINAYRDNVPLTPAEIAERIGKRVDLIIETEPSPPQATTVVDLTGDVPELVRRGCGDPALLGLED
ncbi:MAG: Sua5/YciO/YrdC/YwlC family protein, partial [Rhodocyclaceae bacterium]|nr:Sua5/YciO/YrdC/YwlC family protein [Rhodocyclaceae bacterium]